MPNQNPEPKPQDRALAIVESSLAEYRPEFERLLAGTVDPEVFMSVATEAFRSNEKLLKIALTAPDSLMKALHDAAALKLVPNGVLGSAYIVPRWNSKTRRDEAYFQAGYRGLVDLIIRSGKVSHVESRVVYEQDDFELVYGTSPNLKHVPFVDGNRGKVRGAYAVGFMLDGSTVVEFMTAAQIDAIRKRSPAKDSGPWVTDYEEMSRKTVVRRLAKSLPMSVEVQRAIELDDRANGAEETIVATVEQAPEARSLAGRIRSQLASKEEPKNVTPEPKAEPEPTGAEPEPVAFNDPQPESQPPQHPETAPAAKRTRSRATKAAKTTEQASDAPEADSARPDASEASDDVPDQPQQPLFVADAEPSEPLNHWDGVIEPQPKGGVKLITKSWKAKLVPPSKEDRMAAFFDGLEQSYSVTLAGSLELVPWERDGKSMPPYRQITVYSVEITGAIDAAD